MGEFLLNSRQSENADLTEGILQQEGEYNISIMAPFCWKDQQLEPMWEKLLPSSDPWCPDGVVGVRRSVPRAHQLCGPFPLYTGESSDNPLLPWLSATWLLWAGCCSCLFEMIIFYTVTVQYCSIFCNCGLRASNVQ